MTSQSSVSNYTSYFRAHKTKTLNNIYIGNRFCWIMYGWSSFKTQHYYRTSDVSTYWDRVMRRFRVHLSRIWFNRANYISSNLARTALHEIDTLELRTCDWQFKSDILVNVLWSNNNLEKNGFDRQKPILFISLTPW